MSSASRGLPSGPIAAPGGREQVFHHALAQQLIGGPLRELQDAAIDVDDRAVVRDDQALLRRVDQLLVAEQHRALGLAGDQHCRQHGQHHHDACGRDRDCQRCIVDVGARQRHRGIGGEHHRSHGREVQTADGNHQQCRTDPRRPTAVQLVPGEEGGCREHNADQDRRCHEALVPLHRTGKCQRLHAHEMHEGDACTYDRAAGRDCRAASVRR